MSLTRRGFLGALAAIAAAPAAMLAAAKATSEKFAPKRQHPIGEVVMNAVRWRVEHSGVRRDFESQQTARKKLLEWGRYNRMRLIPDSFRYGETNYGLHRYVSAKFIQE